MSTRANLAQERRWTGFVLAAAACASVWGACAPAAAQGRALGLDVSAWQGNISQTTWNNIHNVENRDFVFIRASRGGTTGFYNQSNPDNDNPPGQNTLSQRYDDPYFVQNITRATTAGMFAGPYHFGRMDVVASTPFSGGIANSGTDEADHFLQMAGAWMRPGYLRPVFDFESGSGIRTASQLAQFAIDFSDRIYEVMGIRPAVYIGGNYASPMNSIPEAAELVADLPTLWSARWPNQDDPDSIPVQTAHPGDFTPTVYGPWDNPPNPPDPWAFWQYASTGRLESFNNGNSNLDFDVAQGGTEFLKDRLVPALWMNDTNGEWTTVENWNSGQTPITPVQGPGQVPRVGPLTLPTTRLPGADDTVILDRPNADVAVTLTSGTHNIRKLYVREALDVTGGSLTVNYVPAADSTPIGAQFSAPVSLSGGASLSVHTLQVDATQTFTLEGGTLAFDTIQLMPHASAPAKIAVAGDVNFNPLANAAAAIVNGAGGGSSGLVDLGGANRVFHVADGAANVDLAINVPIANGALTKNGAGTLALSGTNVYTGDTTLLQGTLSIGSPVLSSMANVYLATGTTLELGFSGTPNNISGLYIDGAPQIEGLWGAVDNVNAEYQSPLITGAGLLNVTQFVQQPTVLANFESNEEPFGWPPTFSGSNVNISNSSAIDRTTADAFEGAASQQIDIVPSGSGDWLLRHVSGTGPASNAAAPAGNVPFTAEGFVGFWLKTTDPGVSVQIALDDPGTADRGAAKPLVADGLWHLYEWDLDDADQWEGWVSGDGTITGPTVTLDSIQFSGAGDATIWLDLVKHNPLGSLLSAVLPGDYNRDGVVGSEDYTTWKNAFGQSLAAGTGADGNGDGVIDAADYTVWRDNLGVHVDGPGGTGSLESPPPVPEPSGWAHVLAGLLAWAARQRTRQLRPDV